MIPILINGTYNNTPPRCQVTTENASYWKKCAAPSSPGQSTMILSSMHGRVALIPMDNCMQTLCNCCAIQCYSNWMLPTKLGPWGRSVRLATELWYDGMYVFHEVGLDANITDVRAGYCAHCCTGGNKSARGMYMKPRHGFRFEVEICYNRIKFSSASQAVFTYHHVRPGPDQPA